MKNVSGFSANHIFEKKLDSKESVEETTGSISFDMSQKENHFYTFGLLKSLIVLKLNFV